MENENSFLEGNGIIILILFFLMFGWGGAGFGNNGGNIRADMADGFNTHEIQRNQYDIVRDIGTVRYDNAIGQAGISKDMLLGFQGLQSQNQMCCCELKTAIHAEGEATRALITENEIQRLRSDLQAAQLQLGNVAQTNTLLAAINPTPRPAYIVGSPYASTACAAQYWNNNNVI